MKRIIMVIAILFLAIAGFFVHSELTAKPVIQNGLTERSKEYIKKQSKNNDAFRYADLEGGKDASRSGKVTVDNCFSFDIPFAVTHSRIDDECEATYGISQGGNIIAYKRKAELASFDSVPGVSMRRKDPEKYKEETEVLNGHTFLLFTVKEEQTKNAFYYEDGFYFVINLIAPISPVNDKKFNQMLESVEFL